MNYLKMLKESYQEYKGNCFDCEPPSKLNFISTQVFLIWTYDDCMDEKMGLEFLKVCDVITKGDNFLFIDTSGGNYELYLRTVSYPFFEGKLEWGNSIRGAWWVHDLVEIDSCGLHYKGKQLLKEKFDMRVLIPTIQQFLKGEDNVKFARLC